MGYLHEGHLSLVKRAKNYCDVVVVSIFVNPTQFSPNEDLDKYPRNIEKDKALLQEMGVDVVFIPEVSEIYSEDFSTYVEVEGVSKLHEGEFRPTHFKGVTTIVSILFNAVKPDAAFFGQKDAQQAYIIKRMVRDLKFDIDINICPIVREDDGLAKSSRNIYLAQQERKDALVLSQALKIADDLVKAGERSSGRIVDEMKKILLSAPSASPDYVRIVSLDNFKETESLETGKEYYLLIACKIGKTRLIDNSLITIK
jgi:pantoate--beta-alanine ligase